MVVRSKYSRISTAVLRDASKSAEGTQTYAEATRVHGNLHKNIERVFNTNTTVVLVLKLFQNFI
jgi:hypothetical protein